MGTYSYIFIVNVGIYDDEVETVAGITFANSYTEAMSFIMKDYGDEIIEVLCLKEIDEEKTFELPESVIKAIKDGKLWKGMWMQMVNMKETKEEVNDKG